MLHKRFPRLVRLRRDLSAFGVVDAEIAEKGHLWTEAKLFWSELLDSW
jgi:hypothetical protein